MKNIFLQKLQEREEQNLLRNLELPEGIDFCSNDYLGFANDVILQKEIIKKIEDTPTGSTGSRLLRGHHLLTEELESVLAQWCGREAALFFPSGYQANIAVLSTLLTKETVVFSDESNHASIIDGIKMSGAEKEIFLHNNLEDLESKLKKYSSQITKYVVIESLYSMQGDRAPLKAIAELCLREKALLIVDETHATGVFGSGLVDRGSLQGQVFMSIHSAGKALGLSGAWVACDLLMKDYFVNFCRPFVYSTAPSPMMVQALLVTLDYWKSVGEERAKVLLDKAAEIKKALGVFLKEEMLSGDGPILFMKLGQALEALSWSHYLKSCDLDIRAIRYPTVREEESGIRVSIHSNQSPEDIKKLIRAFKDRVLQC